MKASTQIDERNAKIISKRLKVDSTAFDLGAFRDALNIELRAEIKEGELHEGQDLSEQELEAIGRITIAHMNPFQD